MFLYWSKVVALVSLAVLLSFGSYLVWTVSRTIPQISQQTSVALYNVGVAAYNLDLGERETFDNLNRLCDTGKPCGTFADVNKTLGSVRLASGQITALSQFEKPQLEAINSQELQLFADTHKVLNGLSETVISTNTAVANIVPLEHEIDTEAVALQKSTLDFDALIVSPDITGTLHGLNTTSNNFGAISTDFKTKFHAILYPPPCQGKMCFVIKAWPYIKTGTELAEPAYYFSQLLGK